MINQFFESLAERANNENALSDVTYALACSNIEFKKFFLSYFFEEFQEVDNLQLAEIKLTREYTRGNSRPDFYFEFNSKEYLIEVKIYDQNHHFKQYIGTFPNAKYGYIINYYYSKNQIEKYGISKQNSTTNLYALKTWEDFYARLKSADIRKNDKSGLVEGYLHYLIKTCEIVEIGKMNLANSNSLYYFILELEKITSSWDNERFPIVSKSADVKKGWFGFNMRFGVDGKEVYVWFGVWFCSKPSICFELSNEIIKQIKPLIDERIKNKGDIQWNGEWIEMTEGEFNAFNSIESSDKQIEKLDKFFNENLNWILDSIHSTTKPT